MRDITKHEFDVAKRSSAWDFGNSILYDLCRNFPQHTRVDEIIAKVWLIGRSYSAAIERRPTVEDIGDAFYENIVAPTMQAAQIDSWLTTLQMNSEPGSAVSISIHKRLQDLFLEIARHNKRSLASKYLHFHYPETFFLYDDRALSAIKKLSPDPRKLPVIAADTYDGDYLCFVRRCIWLRKRIFEQYATWLTPRELDKILLAIADRERNPAKPRVRDEFRSLLTITQQQASKAGMKELDIDAAIRKVRKRA